MRKRPIAFDRARHDARPHATPAGAGDWRAPLQGAKLRSMAVVVGLGTVALVGALVDAARLTVNAHGVTAANHWAVMGAIMALAVGATFVSTLWRYTSHVKRYTWDMERRQSLDLDGDGVIGKPERKRVRLVNVTSQGKRQEPIAVFDDEPDEAPILEGFEVDAADLAAFLQEAGARGLSRRAWLKSGEPRFKLPSGQRVRSGQWKSITGELVRNGWAESDNQGTRLTVPVGELLRRLEDLY